MIKILANDGIHPDCKTLLEEAGYHIDFEKIPDEKLPEVLPAYDVIIIRSATSINRELIDRCPDLKIIARAGVSLDNIDVEHAREKGITVLNTPAAAAHSVAELVFAHLFLLSRRLHLSNREMPLKGTTDFKMLKEAYSEGVQLRGKTLGIIGFGRVGQEVARIGTALGMTIMPVDLIVREADIDINVFKSEDVSLHVRVQTYDPQEVLAKSDYLTIHVPFTGGRPLIGPEEMTKMKNSAILVNTSRGGAVDEAALLQALNEGRLGGAALDVFENEPVPRQELLNHPLISVSPHIGSGTLEAQANIGLELADKILAFFGDDQ